MEELYSRLGVRILPQALAGVGAFADQRKYKGPRFRDAWPIEIRSGADPAAMEPLYELDGKLLALHICVGSGGAVVLADSRFFSSTNVERMGNFHAGNLGFVYTVCERFLGADYASVKPLFEPPPPLNAQ